ncbi:MAG: hypothetical protein V3V47_06205 [Desulfobacteria bacterium]
MKTERYPSNALRTLLKAQKIASMSELKAALGTHVDVTVFRKLAELGYRTSYSNRGQYYTLEQIPTFDRWGLWSFRAVYFSEHGTLCATAEARWFADAISTVQTTRRVERSRFERVESTNPKRHWAGLLSTMTLCPMNSGSPLFCFSLD